MPKDRVNPRTPEAPTDEVKTLRRRLIGAVLILMLIVLLIPFLDTEPDVEGYDISLDIPDAPAETFKPGEVAVPADVNTAAVSGSENTMPPAEPLRFKEEQSSDSNISSEDEEMKALEAQRKQLEAQRADLQRQLDAQKEESLRKAEAEKRKQEEMRKKAEADAKKAEALKNQQSDAVRRKKIEEQLKIETEKNAELQRQLEAEKKARQSVQEQPQKEVWISPAQSKSASVKQTAKSSDTETDRAMAILEGKSQSASKAASANKKYIIQIGAFREEWRMNALKTKISELGLTPFVETATINGITQNRLRVGPFDSRQSAERGLKKLNTIQLNGIISER